MNPADSAFDRFAGADAGSAVRDEIVDGDPRGVAAALVALGDECERRTAGDPATALAVAEALAELARVRGHGSAAARALRASVPGLAYLGRLADAVARADEAHAAGRAAGDPIEAARAQVASMHALTLLGRTDEAITRGGEAAAALLAAGRGDLAARAELNLANVFKSRGEHEAALAALERALAGVPASDRMARGTIENTLGETLLQLDRLDESRAAFTRAAELLGDLPLARALVVGNLADLSARQGLLGEALRDFDAAAEAMAPISPVHHTRLLLEKAEVLATLGAHGEALTAADGALAVAETRGLEAERARGLLVRARCLLATGEPEAAAAMTVASLDRARAMKDARGVRAAALAGAEVALARGDAARATELATVARGEGASALDRARAGICEARARLFAGDAAEGLRCATDSRGIAAELAVPTVEIDAWCAVAACARALGSTDDAIAALESAVAAAERLRGTLAAERHRTAFAASRVRAYEELALDLLARGDDASLDRAFLAVERARSRLLLDTVLRAIDRGGDLAASDPELSALRAKLAALHASRLAEDDRASDADDTTRRGVSPAQLAAMRATEDAIDALVTRGRVRAGGLASLFAEPLATASIRAALGEGDALVSYFACGDELLAFVATRETVVPVRAIGSMREIDPLVEKTLFRLRGAARRSEDERRARTTTALLAALHDALVAPVLEAAPAARDARRLVIVPFGALHAVPFAALRGRDHWLVERHEIAVAPSASLACVPPCGTRARAADGTAPMLVVGVADEVAPRIDAEVEAIARRERCEVLAGESATIAAVRAAVRGRAAIHFACHGRFLPALPNASGIRLADGWMPVREIVALGLDADLVFLSACESGRHAVDAGEELSGIARAFLAAGARRVVTSLWPVRDAAAEAIATGYHAEARLGKRPSAALRDSMLAAARFLPHPCDWSAFTVSGGL